jgi:hypothetical protein
MLEDAGLLGKAPPIRGARDDDQGEGGAEIDANEAKKYAARNGLPRPERIRLRSDTALARADAHRRAFRWVNGAAGSEQHGRSA